MKKFYFLFSFFLFLIGKPVIGQYNLVPNPSFELYDTCPNNGGQLRYALYWTNPLISTSPDYLNACSSNFGAPMNGYGYETAHSGVAYAFIITAAHFPNEYYGREYIQAKLIDTLLAGENYCIRFYVSAGDSLNYVSNSMGVYFSNIEIQDTCPGPSPFCGLPYVPQFENPNNNSLSSRIGWTEVSGTYTATGGENYIIIGNFRDSANTIATYTGWGPTYYPWAGYYIDDVLITPCDSLTVGIFEINRRDFKISPNPANGIFYLAGAHEDIMEVKIFNVTGEKIYENYNVTLTDKIPINIEKQPNGIYILSILTQKNKYNIKLIKK